MKFTLVPLIALMAVPGSAQVLDKPVNVVIATDWKDGFVDDVLIHSIRQGEDARNEKISVDVPGHNPATLELTQVSSFDLKEVGETYEFTMDRDKWPVPTIFQASQAPCLFS